MSILTTPAEALVPAETRTASGRWWRQGWLALSDVGRGGLDAPLRERPAGTAGARPQRLVARTWHGRVPIEKADEYERYLQSTGYPDYRATPGHRGLVALRHDEGGVAHFVLTTLWVSREAIARFAGADIDAARYYPRDREFLIELEPRVQHADVLVRR